MSKSRWILALTLASLLIVPIAWAQAGPGMGQGMGPGMGQGMGPGMGQGMGPGMGQGMRGTGPAIGQPSPAVEQIVSWVANPNFSQWILRHPGMATEIAQVPFAANLFYEQPYFRDWSHQYPQLALMVMESAMQWQTLSPPAKASFFRNHPNLRPSPGAAGSPY